MPKENRMAEQCWRTLATIKDSILISSDLAINFWAETIDKVNYLHNHLPTKRDSSIIIPEETWTNVRQKLEHVCIFKTRVSIFTLTQKRLKSDIRKT